LSTPLKPQNLRSLTFSCNNCIVPLIRGLELFTLPRLTCLGIGAEFLDPSIVENIAYLPQYLEQPYARVKELEKELANVVCCLFHPTCIDHPDPTTASRSNVDRAQTLEPGIGFYRRKLQGEIYTRQKQKDGCVVREAPDIEMRRASQNASGLKHDSNRVRELRQRRCERYMNWFSTCDDSIKMFTVCERVSNPY
jgi:hypothetical protein